MAQITCGTFKRLDQGDGYGGRVVLGSRLDGLIFLVRIKRERTSDQAPDYEVSYQPAGGPRRVMGAAWIKNHPNVGDFLSITMDDPDWSSTLNLTAFPPASSGNGEWSVVWSRPRQARPQEAEQPL